METNMETKILFRCSELGKIMTSPRVSVRRGKVTGGKAHRPATHRLSQTCKAHLMDVLLRYYFNREKDFDNYYVMKGMMVEEDAITLYSRYLGRFIKKNDNVLRNEYLSGCPDCIDNDQVIEIKSSYDIHTHFGYLRASIERQDVQKLVRNYYWQCQGYLALTGLQIARLVFCLIDTPETIVNDQKRRLLWRMNVSESDQLYQEAADKIDANARFEDVPIALRIVEFSIERNQDDIDAIYDRVRACREYIGKFIKKINYEVQPTAPNGATV